MIRMASADASMWSRQLTPPSDHLLLPPELEEVGPYEVPLPREIEDLYTYVPAW